MLTSKKVLVSLVLATIGFVACATKAPPSAPLPPPVVATAAPVASAAPDAAAPQDDDSDDASAPAPGPVQAQVVTADNVTFTLPAGETWHEMQPPADEIISMWRDSSRRGLLLLTKDPFKGSTQMLALVALKGLKASGGTVKAVKQVTIHGKKMVLMNTTRSSLAISVWMLAENGVAYNLMCGGPADDDSVSKSCTAIANSLTIK